MPVNRDNRGKITVFYFVIISKKTSWSCANIKVTNREKKYKKIRMKIEGSLKLIT